MHSAAACNGRAPQADEHRRAKGWFRPSFAGQGEGSPFADCRHLKAHEAVASTHRNPGSGLGALYLLQEIPAWIVDFEVEGAFIGFAVDRDRIQLVYRERGAERAIRAKHQADMMQLNSQMADLLPDAIANISAGGRQKRVFKLGSVRVPGLE